MHNIVCVIILILLTFLLFKSNFKELEVKSLYQLKQEKNCRIKRPATSFCIKYLNYIEKNLK